MAVRCCAVVMEQGTMVCGENYLPEGGHTLQKYMCGLLDGVLGLLFLPLMRSWTSTTAQQRSFFERLGRQEVRSG